jgi:hypothetical protein
LASSPEFSFAHDVFLLGHRPGLRRGPPVPTAQDVAAVDQKPASIALSVSAPSGDRETTFVRDKNLLYSERSVAPADSQLASSRTGRRRRRRSRR